MVRHPDMEMIVMKKEDYLGSDFINKILWICKFKDSETTVRKSNIFLKEYRGYF